MVSVPSAGRSVSETWTYALVGGVPSLLLALGLYWQSGAGDEMSLNAVLLGGALVGYLIERHDRDANATAAGARAGAIGGLAGAVLLRDLFAFFGEAGGPAWFRVVGLVFVGGLFVTMCVGFSAVGGGLAAKVGGWVAERIGEPPARAAES